MITNNPYDILALLESAYMEGLSERMQETPHFQWLNSNTRHAFLAQVRTQQEDSATGAGTTDPDYVRLQSILSELSHFRIRKQIKATQAMMEQLLPHLSEMLEITNRKLDATVLRG